MSKVLVIGSGPIVIGQAAEFDYAGTQACKSLKEEGHEVVLINSNPATIMTDPGVADCLYIEPLTPEFCERVIARERPDALLPTLGGQTGLNLATQLADQGILEKYNVKLLGTPLSAIRKAEDRELFRNLMREIREPVPESFIIESEADLKRILPTQVPDENGRQIEFPYPRIVRPAYTLGGTGGGIAHDADELWEIGRKGLKLSMRSQVMIERSLLGWKEVEYEVMRDSVGNCITVCNMENFDPMGVHTGDSIVIAPSQTLSDLEYHMLRTASLKIIQALGIEGGCNVQLAVNPDSFDYYVIEVNPRVSRSSALASKATGYPIARVAAKIAVGKTLDQIENQVTRTTKACFEPALDYVVVKIPRWPFDKFSTGDRSLFTQMKATGEVMAIDRTFEAAFLKAIRGLEVKPKDLWHEGYAGPLRSSETPTVPEASGEIERSRAGESGRDAQSTCGRDPHTTDADLVYAIKYPTDERLWAICEGLRRGWGVDEVNRICRVDKWFLNKIQKLIDMETALRRLPEGKEDGPSPEEIVPRALAAGFSPTSIEQLVGIDEAFKADVLRLNQSVTHLMDGLSVSTPTGNGASAKPSDSNAEAKTGYDEFWQKYDSGDPAFIARFGVHVCLSSGENRRVFKMVDTCAGEFESKTPYYYATFEDEDDAVPAGLRAGA